MPERRSQHDPEFKAGAVRIVLETGRPAAEVARELGIGAGALGNWVRKDRAERAEECLDGDDRADLARLRKRCAAPPARAAIAPAHIQPPPTGSRDASARADRTHQPASRPNSGPRGQMSPPTTGISLRDSAPPTDCSQRA